jgi:hypothetical protein
MHSPLVLVAANPDKGWQENYPAIATPYGVGATKPHQIPAARNHPTKPGQLLTGVGAYQFRANLAAAASGALAFSYKDGSAGPLVAIAYASWIGGQFFAVTSDLSNYNGDLANFYNTTANAGKSVAFDIGTEATIWGGWSASEFVLTVWLRPYNEI